MEDPGQHRIKKDNQKLYLESSTERPLFDKGVRRIDLYKQKSINQSKSHLKSNGFQEKEVVNHSLSQSELSKSINRRYKNKSTFDVMRPTGETSEAFTDRSKDIILTQVRKLLAK